MTPQTQLRAVDRTILDANASATRGSNDPVWTLCINPHNNPVEHYFYRRKITDKYFAENDKTSICSLCWRISQEKNGTLPKKDVDVSEFVHHKSIDSKPQNDSL